MKNNILEKLENFCEDLYCWVDDDMGGHFEVVIGNQFENTKLGYLVLKKKIENVLSELETYKKIADLMAKQIDNYDTQLVINRFRSKEDVLDWARKEVENENNN